MKKLFITLFVIMTGVVMLAGQQRYTFVFRDALVTYLQYDESRFSIPDNFNLLWVSGAKSWYVDEENTAFPFKLVDINDFSQFSLKEIYSNVFEIEGRQDILFYNSRISKWCLTDKKNLDSIRSKRTLILDTQGKTFIGLYASGNWKNTYEIDNMGNFISKLEINGVPVGETRLYLVNSSVNISSGYYQQEALLRTKSIAYAADSSNSYEAQVQSDTLFFDLGMVDMNSEYMALTADRYKLASFEDRYTVNPNLYSNITDPQPASIIRYFDNTVSNGIGKDLASGEVWLMENFDENTFAIKKGYIRDTPKDSEAWINLKSSWSLKYKSTITKDVTYNTTGGKDKRIMQVKIEFQNASSETYKTRIYLSQPGITLDSFTNKGVASKIDNKSQGGIVWLDFDVSKDCYIELNLSVEK